MALSDSRLSAGTDPYATRPVERAASVRTLAYLALAASGMLALFLLSRPYGGIIHDARLYIGYALAALHPGSLGDDMVLADRGQSGFTVSPALLLLLVEALGSSLAAKLVSLAGLVLWFGAAAALMAGLAYGRTRWVMLIFVAVMPAYYAGYEIFSYAEAVAGPRPYGEAFVLLALALLAADWKFAALLPLLVAALLHPIMALPGVAVWFWLVAFDSQMRVVRPIAGIAAGLIGLAGLALAAALGISVAGRLFTAVDPTWRDILMTRSPYLFVTAWSFADWGRLIVQAVTVAIAASLLTGRARSLFIAAAVIGVGGVLVSLLFGDVLDSLLVMQVQPWRTTWLLAVFAAAGLGLCSVVLWQRGSLGRLTLAVLVLAWIELQLPLAAVSARSWLWRWPSCRFGLSLTFAGWRSLSGAPWLLCAFFFRPAPLCDDAVASKHALGCLGRLGADQGPQHACPTGVLPRRALGQRQRDRLDDGAYGFGFDCSRCDHASAVGRPAVLGEADRPLRTRSEARETACEPVRGGIVDRRWFRHLEPGGAAELGEPSARREQRLLAGAGLDLGSADQGLVGFKPGR